jgi:HEPN domain-containing protein
MEVIMEKEVKNWLDSAQYDLETAKHMFKASRYIYTVFMCHLAIEKALKAKVREISDKTPPRTHNLLYLKNLGGISPSNETLQFLEEINSLSVVTRYSEDFQEMLKSFSKERTKEILDKSKEVFKWIKELIKP